MGCQKLIYKPELNIYSSQHLMEKKKKYIGVYRYSFNGKEMDNENGTQDYGMRIYNPALAKFLSVDPLSPKYPELTPYQFASNTPISAIDIDGLEGFVITQGKTYNQGTNELDYRNIVTVDPARPLGSFYFIQNKSTNAFDCRCGCSGTYLTYKLPKPSFITLGPLIPVIAPIGTSGSNTPNSLAGLASAIFEKQIATDRNNAETLKGTTQRIVKPFSSNQNLEGENFTINGTFTKETRYIDYRIEATVTIGANDPNSDAVKTLANDFLAKGYKVEYTKIDPSRPLNDIRDTKNPGGVTVELNVKVIWNKVETKSTSVNQVTHNSSGQTTTK